jgi:hypothetical protein
MEQPYDDDDMINDYVDDYEEPPPEYDDDMLDETMGEKEPAQSVAASPPQLVASPPMAPTQLFHEELRVAVESTTGVDGENAVNVTEFIARQNNDSHLYNFER